MRAGDAYAFFESGGRELPQIGRGFGAAPIHAHYELAQRRFEHFETDEMERALSAALLKTTGDEKFRKGAEEEEAAGGGQEESTGQFATRERPRYEADLKYRVPQLGDIDSSAHVRRHTHRLNRTHTAEL